MAPRLYLVPVVGAGSKADPRRPKYFSSAADGTGRARIVTFAAMGAFDFGFEPWMLVGADLSAADAALIIAQPDGMAIPVDMDVVLTAGQVTSVQTKLEAINVPAGWVTTALTWREVVRIVCGMFAVVQRYAGIHGTARVFGGAVTLSSTIGSLSAAVRTDLLAAAQSFDPPLDTSSIGGATTLRATLKILADQFVGRPFHIGPVVV